MWTKKTKKKKVKADQAGDSFGEQLSPEEIALDTAQDVMSADPVAVSEQLSEVFSLFSKEDLEAMLASLQAGNVPAIFSKFEMEGVTPRERVEFLADTIERVLNK